MAFEITNKKWHQAFGSCAQDAQHHALIVSPFLGKTVVERLLGDSPQHVKVVTRFNLDELSKGVSDVEALDYLLSVGAQVKGIKHLHAKVYVLGSQKAIVTSANLTHAGLFRNAEYGVQSSDPEFVRSATDYFDELWAKAGSTLTVEKLAQWKRQIADQLTSNSSFPGQPPLGDFGTDIGLQEVREERHTLTEAPPWRWFVKFCGTNSDRLPVGTQVQKVISDSDSSTRLWYPKNKRPRKVENGDLVFIGQLVTPADILVYGRARTFEYVPGRDEATPQEIKDQSWKADWPHYVRLDRAEFVNGTLNDCISLYELMDELGSDTFATTRDRALSGEEGINPRAAYGRQPAVWLTARAAEILNNRLDAKFSKLGRIPATTLARAVREVG